MHLPKLRILTLGHGDTEKMQGPLFRHLGQLNDPAEICEAYNLADIFVIPTLQDNFPNTVIESLASGTPVVGFATGGVVDAVEQGVSGLLAPTGDIAGFARHITEALTNDPLRASMGLAARARAVEYYSLERQAKACAALYHRMVAGGTNDDRPFTGLRPAPAASSPADQSLTA
jgi:glycosyltransferase involved in cell wall biosynthesis